MEANRYVALARLRTLAAILYATAVCGSLIWLMPRSQATPPILFIALGLPLVFRLVPRNWFYGMRSPRTLWTTEETWYRQNFITGVAMTITGVVWLLVLAAR